MNWIYSDLCLLGGDPVQNAAQLKEYGAQKVELIMDGKGWEKYLERSHQLVSGLQNLGLAYSLHSPCWDINLSSENHHIRAASLQSSLDAVTFAAALGCEYLVIHPGVCQSSGFDPVIAAQRTKDALSTICQYAGQLGVTIAVENVGHHGSSLYTMEQFCHLLDDFDHHVKYLIDTGHAFLNGWDLPHLIQQLNHRLCGVHLHDNDRAGDSHLPMGLGQINWPPIAKQLGQLSSHCGLVMEYAIGTEMDIFEQSKQRYIEFLAQ